MIGIPGKLDHASIVCYEVGIHGNLNTFKLDRQKSSPAGINTEGELPPNTDEGESRVTSRVTTCYRSSGFSWNASSFLCQVFLYAQKYSLFGISFFAPKENQVVEIHS